MPGMSPSPFNVIKPLAGRALEVALNRALALDPDTRSALATLDGQRIALTLESPALAMQIGVSGQRLTVGPVDPAQEADLAVRSTLGGVLAQLPFLANARRGNSAPAGRVKVSGDAELARRLQQLASRFDPDWQQPFVKAFGEVLGVQIAQTLRAALVQARRSARDLAESAAEYVTEESRDVVPRAELEAFHDDVDVIRDDVERLGVRVARLRQRLGGAA
ncbi:SCP2 domain-containing protein [Stenotrophomonas sp. ATCM1_4]|jgi:ubiquinone biosynthesis protein UbiJ|uniref:Ubiquinone biosynthesis accessory factor UbiJ n=2 Tax=Lysobacteraceae TaxID=32033 RepID=A0ABU5V2F9_9GAMM|nr:MULTISPECIES: SCP2 sterol-binding domain-containing protein [unclassified Stenotrophomonas]MEA5666255.1 SCP2 sterol-binding domain-containing protein [Stenotrophomonas sp. MH1]TDB27416.1 SCP2 domain-containing protein [Stenotrophomonas sp. ATCM1_4]